MDRNQLVKHIGQHLQVKGVRAVGLRLRWIVVDLQENAIHSRRDGCSR